MPINAPSGPIFEKLRIMELKPPTIFPIISAIVVSVGNAFINASRIAPNKSSILVIKFSIESPNFKNLSSLPTTMSPNFSKFFLRPLPSALMIPPRNLLMILLAALNLCRYAVKEPKADLTLSQNDKKPLKKP